MIDASGTDDVARYNQVCNVILLSSASSNGQPARASFFTTSCGREHDAQVITAVRSLPMKLRLKSKRWLEERGLKAPDFESGHRGRQ
ncbi:hypothetical protein AB7G19_22335 [Bradyrhizobium sp. 215_C5_N1_1]|uniref:hypothetical protein n=1 Tax=unclassified Bradyrhizobium TaxID=2631580 RepID=UPI003F8CD3D2